MSVIGRTLRASPLIVLLIGGLSAQQPLRWKPGRALPVLPLGEPGAGRDALASQRLRTASSGSGTRQHFLIQFEGEPAPEQREELERRGVRLLEAVPDYAFVISAPGDIDLRETGVVRAGSLAPDEKLSAALAADRGEALVELHRDGSPDEVRAWALAQNLELIENPDLAAHHLLVRGKREQWLALAAHDDVAYLYPAASELLRAQPVLPCLSPLTGGLHPLAISNLAVTFGDGWDGPGLGAARLTYSLGGMAPDLDAESVRAEIRRALAVWSAAVRVDFDPASAVRQPGSLDLFFASGDHGDGFPFDGRGKVLAHTFYPPPNAEPLAGDTHFDADDVWRIGADYDVFSVALHELGHALGLGHNDDPQTVMYPYYRRAAALQPGDIAAIQTLYAARTVTTGGTPSTPPANPTPTPPTAPAPTPPPAPKPPSSPDTTAPTLTITSPSSTNFFYNGTEYVIRGQARDSTHVAQVTWSNGVSSGTCTGTTDWSTPPVKIYVGTNVITIKTRDDAGNTSWRSVYITRR